MSMEPTSPTALMSVLRAPGEIEIEACKNLGAVTGADARLLSMNTCRLFARTVRAGLSPFNR